MTYANETKYSNFSFDYVFILFSGEGRKFKN